MQQLPKGTVKLETVSAERYVGTIARELAPKGGRSEGKHGGSGGTITIAGQVTTAADQQSTGLSLAKTEEISFTASDVQWKKSTGEKLSHLVKGDTVEFNISTRRKQRKAVNITLVRESTARLQGIITASRPDKSFAFIDCPGHTGDNRIFVHESEFVSAPPEAGNKQSLLAEGTEVEFALCADANGKTSATRVVILPKGTVKFEEILPTVYTGTIVRTAVRGSKPAGFNKPNPPQKGYAIACVL